VYETSQSAGGCASKENPSTIRTGRFMVQSYVRRSRWLGPKRTGAAARLREEEEPRPVARAVSRRSAGLGFAVDRDLTALRAEGHVDGGGGIRVAGNHGQRETLGLLATLGFLQLERPGELVLVTGQRELPGEAVREGEGELVGAGRHLLAADHHV